jgi:hypothetical protein
MDQNQLERGLRDVLLAEPPLGLDPDQVADTAARKQRTRRAGIGTSVGVLAVAGLAAGTIAFTSGAGPGATTPGATPTTGQHQQVPEPEPVDPNITHLREVLPKVMPNARDIKVDADLENGGASPNTTVRVTFTDSAGPGSFNVTWNNIAGDMTLDQQCETPHGAKPKRFPNGTPLRCEKHPQPGGDTVVLEDDGLSPNLDGIVPKVTRILATDFRSGNFTVSIWNDLEKPAHSHGDLWRSRFPLTDAQLIELVTDPGFKVQ